MDINDIPSEILEKIIIEGSCNIISKVCLNWREHALNNRFKFNEVRFDITKDDPKNIKKKNPNNVFIYNSQSFDEINNRNNVLNHNQFYSFGYFNKNKYFLYNYKKSKIFIANFSSINSLNIIFNPLTYIKGKQYSLYYFNFCLCKRLKIVNRNVQEIIMDFLQVNSPYFKNLLFLIKNKTNYLNIKIKDFCDKLESIYYAHFFNIEIVNLSGLINGLLFIEFEKFTYNAPNNTYIIYDQDKKILIIRYGNYEKYKFLNEKAIGIRQIDCNFYGPTYLTEYIDSRAQIPICRICSKINSICMNKFHKRYFVNCFKYFYFNNYLTNFYPAILILDDYKKLLSSRKIEKLIIISNEFYQFVFDELFEISKFMQKEKIIQYHCLNQNRKTFIQDNFAFIPIDKKQEKNYSFDQMYFNLYKKNIY